MADLDAWLDKNKTLWTRVYDEVIAPDFEQEWKKRACMSSLYSVPVADGYKVQKRTRKS
jgi:hypothetical protein